jgi:hypothetical protein
VRTASTGPYGGFFVALGISPQGQSLGSAVVGANKLQKKTDICTALWYTSPVQAAGEIAVQRGHSLRVEIVRADDYRQGELRSTEQAASIQLRADHFIVSWTVGKKETNYRCPLEALCIVRSSGGGASTIASWLYNCQVICEQRVLIVAAVITARTTYHPRYSDTTMYIPL